LDDWLGISTQSWLSAGIVFVAMAVILLGLRALLCRLLVRRTSGRWAAVAGLIRQTQPLFLLAAAAYIAAAPLELDDPLAGYLYQGFLAIFLVQVGFWVLALLDPFLHLGGAPDSSSAGRMVDALAVLVQVLVWGIIGLLILENVIGLKVVSLVASLSITGIAVALAVQRILGDVLAALSIALDKPFVVGDSISVADLTGTVEHIGLRSTRLRSIDGELLVFPNADLLNSRIRNYAGVQRRRVRFALPVAYDTPRHKLDAIPGLLREIISSQPQVTFNQAYLKTFGDVALVFEVVYFVESAEYAVFVEKQQVINQAILERFERGGTAFAVPNWPRPPA
jgi:small-conductance mechanosensitive channel